MSNFPFNNEKYEYGEEYNGSPLTFDDACAFCDKVLFWHSNKDTSDWTQSSDGFDMNVRQMAWGLIDILSDPNAVARLITTLESHKE